MTAATANTSSFSSISLEEAVDLIEALNERSDYKANGLTIISGTHPQYLYINIIMPVAGDIVLNVPFASQLRVD